jgi:hypothetical protein
MRCLNTLGKFEVFTNTGTSDEVADYVIFFITLYDVIFML